MPLTQITVSHVDKRFTGARECINLTSVAAPPWTMYHDARPQSSAGLSFPVSHWVNSLEWLCVHEHIRSRGPGWCRILHVPVKRILLQRTQSSLLRIKKVWDKETRQESVIDWGCIEKSQKMLSWLMSMSELFTPVYCGWEVCIGVCSSCCTPTASLIKGVSGWADVN